MATITEHSDGGPDGNRFGQSSTDKIGFFGATPVVRPTTPSAAISTAITAVATTAAVTSTATNWGYASSTQADAIVTAINALILRAATNVVAVNAIKANLDTLGLMG